MKGTVLKAVTAAGLLLGQYVAGPVQADSQLRANSQLVDSQLNAQPRIVGGVDVNISTFPSTIAMLVNSRLNLADPLAQAQFCGGTLIESTWVLTAAHCLVGSDGTIKEPAEISILAGTTNLVEPVTNTTAVSDIFVHPDFQNVFFGDDIALLQLSESAPAPAIRMNDRQLLATEDTFIVGWGSRSNIGQDGIGDFPGTLIGATVPIIQASDCAALPGSYQFVNPDTQICAGLPQGGVDSCQGDSGGPLYSVTAEGNLRLAGITSWGEGCALARRPGIYTDVAAFQQWIDETISSAVPTRILTSNPENPENQDPVPATETLVRSSGGGGSAILFVPFLLLYARLKASIKSHA